MSVIQRIKSYFLPKLVEKGSFGADKVRFIEFLHDEKISANDSVQSNAFFGDIVTERENGDLLTQSIMIKTLPDPPQGRNSGVREWDSWLQFQNEFLFYSEVIPLLTKCDNNAVMEKLFPKFFYGSVTRGGSSMDNILIFENVQKLGFKHNDSKTFMDYDHIKLSLERLGQFHALSFVCKRQFPGQFQDLCSKVSEVAWTEEIVKKRGAYYVENGKRGILPLLKDPQYKDKLADITDAIEEADLSMAKMVVPVEPLAVICHGDFNRNNMFYKYDSSGRPSDTIFFDFGTFRYASPVIDLSYFLFMNSSPEVRSLYWDDMLRTYHAALISNPDIDIRDVASLKDITLDFQRRGLYGYVHACHFLPFMSSEEDKKITGPPLCEEDLIKIRIATGGERATGYVVEMVKHMIDKQFDFKFMRSVATKF